MTKQILCTILLSSFLMACGGASTDTAPEDDPQNVDDGLNGGGDTNGGDTNGGDTNGFIVPDPQAFYTGSTTPNPVLSHVGSLTVHPRLLVENTYSTTFFPPEKVSSENGIDTWEVNPRTGVIHTAKYTKTDEQEKWQFYLDGTQTNGVSYDNWLEYEHIEKSNGDSNWIYYHTALGTDPYITMNEVGSRVDILVYNPLSPNIGDLKTETIILFETPTKGRLAEYDRDANANNNEDNYIYTFDDSASYWWVGCSGELETANPADVCNTVLSDLLNQ